MADKAPDWASPELFRLSEQDFEEAEFSKLLLLVVRRLDAAFPSLIDLTTCIRIIEHIEEFSQLWGWLKDQGIVCGHVSNGALTLSGKRAFKAALELSPAMGSRFMHSHDGLEGEEASKMLQVILRYHFENFGNPAASD
ncbi:MAG: hypothetical protein GY948_16000 [Alphaproteobacteria bacterium]|nr:hypothetical protein [Alphaproteobacteria bacterium]